MIQTSPYVATVVDETGKVATLGGVYDGVMVDAEHVAAADAFFFVALLSHVGNHLMEEKLIYDGFATFTGRFLILNQTK